MAADDKLPESDLEKEKLSTDDENADASISFEEDVRMFPENGTEKFKFTSTFSTYMTLLGYSIGMSDFWRFPFLAYRNGGGKCDLCSVCTSLLIRKFT